jgi:hypothetical protein
VLLRVEKERNILQTTKRRKAKWIGHILRRNSLIRHFIERDRRNDRSGKKTRKKKKAATG